MKTRGRNEPCWCGSGVKLKFCHGRPRVLRTVPAAIEQPPYRRGDRTEGREPAVKDPDTIERMRRSGQLAADIVAAVSAEVRPGVTTEALDEVAHQLAVEAGAYPSPLGYGPPDNLFPASLCTSVNEEICHGIPGGRVLAEGDIVSLDVTVFREGVHGDTCVTVPVGEIDERSARLIESTRLALADAIATVRPGASLSEAGRAIQSRVEPDGFAVVRDFVGHGIGHEFHGRPQVPHYFVPGLPGVSTGMTFTIEPMISAGAWQVEMQPDGWTATTADGSRCAQFEHTLLVVDDGVDILTTPSPGIEHPYWP